MSFCLSLKILFKLPLRQAAGMVAGLPKLAGHDGQWGKGCHASGARCATTPSATFMDGILFA
ncbi:Transposase DDE domain-containing protein [Citreimonas salinaria]|uniref:Transposase DDE domain-containing protein n=1 Tax=Citreimonas salinaria TaxID=321339 RepID=A0A1H3KWC1_9RHOB|nr:Transposase DDE domain-containing protein [Citreimonas salinaria]